MYVLLIVLMYSINSCAQLLPPNRKLWLEAHNKARATQNATKMQEMVWDNGLQILAENWAQTCKGLKHSELNRNTYSYSQVGENIYITNAGDFDFQKAMDYWMDEVKYYDWNTARCEKKQICGHYTQVVWDNSCSVGCAISRCSALEKPDILKGEPGYMVVCNYGPSGNVNGLRPYTKGKKCSSCGGCNKKGLCATKCKRNTLSLPGPSTIKPMQWPLRTFTLSRRKQPVRRSIRPNPKVKKSVKRNRKKINDRRRATKNCSNKHSMCSFWSSKGDCKRKRNFMMAKCRKSCDPKCRTKLCKNHFEQCDLWKLQGNCHRNPEFMMNKCRKSCDSLC